MRAELDARCLDPPDFGAIFQMEDDLTRHRIPTPPSWCLDTRPNSYLCEYSAYPPEDQQAPFGGVSRGA